MDEVIRGFVPITAVAKEYATSRKSVERRRDKARATGDSTVYRQFRLRTKEGETIVEPSLEQVKQLRADGRVPEWFVAREWLQATFGKRKTGTEEGSEQPQRRQVDPATLEEHPYVRMLKQTHSERVADLQNQLQAAERREERMTNLIEAVNKTTQALNQTLALPGIAEAARAQQQNTVNTTVTDVQRPPQKVDSTEADAAGTTGKKPSRKKKRRRKGWWRRLSKQ